MDEKILASNLVNRSIKVKPNEKILITYQNDKPKQLVKYIIDEIVKNKGLPFVKIIDSNINNFLLERTTKNRIKLLAKQNRFEVSNFDSFINISYHLNNYDSKNVSHELTVNIGKSLDKLNDIRINERKWVILNYPSNLDSYKAKMTIDEYREFAFNAMNFDYSKLKKMIKPLVSLMKETDIIRLVSAGTDLSFSINGQNIIGCTGESNIPDGEIYVGPIKNSLNGYITFNTPSPKNGEMFENIKLTFKNGKIINSSCNGNSEKLLDIINTDNGSSYIGEFAIGLNPEILHPMGDILYDEKIIGSIHIAIGASYKDSYNNNESSIHWDLVLIQRKEYGGGEMYFDNVLVRKDGLFVQKELLPLNYYLK